MLKLQTVLSNLYNGNSTMFYFYVVLGILALFFIVLIIITSIKGHKEVKKDVKEEPKETTPITNEPPKDLPLNGPYKSSEITKVEQSIINEPVKGPVDSLTAKETPSYLEKDDININNIYKTPTPENHELPKVDSDADVFLVRKEDETPIEVKEPEVSVEPKKEPIAPDIKEEIKPVFPESKPVENKPVFPESIPASPVPVFTEEEKEEPKVTEMPITEKGLNVAFPGIEDENPVSDYDKSISELMVNKEDPKLFETIQFEKINPLEDNDLNATIEIPKMKPLDINKDLEPEEEKEEPKEEKEPETEKPKPVVLSNEELKERLAKLKHKEVIKEEEPKDDDLANIMKTVGLDNNNVTVKSSFK